MEIAMASTIIGLVLGSLSGILMVSDRAIRLRISVLKKRRIQRAVVDEVDIDRAHPVLLLVYPEDED